MVWAETLATSAEEKSKQEVVSKKRVNNLGIDLV